MIPDFFLDELRALLPVSEVVGKRVTLKKSSGEWKGLSPFNKERSPSFFVNDAKGFYHDFSSGKHGDIFSFVMETDGLTFPEAVMRLADMAGLPTGDIGDRSPNSARDRRQREPAERHRMDAEVREGQRRSVHRADAIWNEALPIARTLGDEYLAKRGIMLDDVPEQGGLRWHYYCPWESGMARCIVSRFTDVITAEPRGILRRPITGEKPKALGPMGGCVIRLWPDEEVTQGLVLGEGVETTLAAATRITHKGTLLRPAWAAGSAGNMASFPVLASIEALTLLVDHDASGAGQRAAEQCRQRWRDTGREVIRLMPADVGADFNDLVAP